MKLAMGAVAVVRMVGVLAWDYIHTFYGDKTLGAAAASDDLGDADKKSPILG